MLKKSTSLNGEEVGKVVEVAVCKGCEGGAVLTQSTLYTGIPGKVLKIGGGHVIRMSLFIPLVILVVKVQAIMDTAAHR